jgi:hypothetical protein
VIRANSAQKCWAIFAPCRIVSGSSRLDGAEAFNEKVVLIPRGRAGNVLLRLLKIIAFSKLKGWLQFAKPWTLLTSASLKTY